MKKKISNYRNLGRLTHEEYAEKSKLSGLGRMDADAYKELHENSRRRDHNDTERNNLQIVNNKG